MRNITAALVLLSVGPLSSLSAQASAAVEPGQRVRVTAPDLGIRKQAGRFEVFRGDTLVVAAADSTMTLPVASVSRLDVSRGRKSNALKGLGIGSLGGAVVGAALGVEASSGNGEALCTGTGVECAALGAAMFGVAGGLVGLGAGALIKTERWEEVPLRLLVSVAPQRDGRFAFGASVSF